MYAEFFGKKLAKARKEAGYTQRQTSKILGIPQSTLANWETGRTQPGLESIGIMADFYATSVDWLLGTQGNNKTQEDSRPKKQAKVEKDAM